MKTFDVHITGTTPLLQHRFTEASEQDKATRKVLVASNTPRAEADKVAYRDPQGRFYFPGAAIARLIREAGGNHKLKGTRKSAKYVVPAAVLVREDAITLLNGDGKTPVPDFGSEFLLRGFEGRDEALVVARRGPSCAASRRVRPGRPPARCAGIPRRTHRCPARGLSRA